VSTIVEYHQWWNQTVVTAVAFYETDVQLTVKASTFDCRDVLEMNRLSLSLSMPRSFLQKYHVIADI